MKFFLLAMTGTLLGACSFAFGKYRADDTKRTLGMSVGTQPGYGYFAIDHPNGGRFSETRGMLHIPMDIRAGAWSLDIGVDAVNLSDAVDGYTHTYRAWPDLLLRRRIMLRSGTHAIAGGGFIIGCVDGMPLLCADQGGIPAKAVRGTVGLQQRIGSWNMGPLLLRLEASAEAGQNNVRQLNVSGGIELWFDVDKRL